MKKEKSKKGLTLIEIIISLAILSILIIPVSNLVLSSVKINKAAEDKQTAVTMAQQVIEEIKALPDFSAAASGVLLTLVPGKTDEFTGTKTLSGDLAAAITIKPKTDLAVNNGYDSSVSYIEYDVDLLIEGVDGNIRIKKINGTNVNYLIDSDKLTVENNTSGIKLIYNASDEENFSRGTGSNGRVRIKFGSNTNITSDLNVKASNIESEALSIYFEADSNAKVSYSIDNLKGKIRKYSNVLKPEAVVNTSRAYEIEVIMTKKGETIYKAKAYKTMY